MVQVISRGVVNCATKVGSLCPYFVDVGALVKTQVENGLNKLLGFRG